MNAKLALRFISPPPRTRVLKLLWSDRAVQLSRTDGAPPRRVGHSATGERGDSVGISLRPLPGRLDE
jgi:hypothetical protein